ncbi:ergosterol biosynthesis protein-like protein Erg28 [Xylariomycetidae sp. FL2044]|nr:ergosterol biosynthesis protein-like protein Erg28 [Xylariomycetidae sp. FL2044]
MGYLAGLLPQHNGFLPYYLLYAAVSASIHSVVCYTADPEGSLRSFSGPGAPPLQQRSLLARVYGLKNVYSSIIRLYAAYYLAHPPVYDMAMLTFVGVLFLYGTEVFVYGTARVREAAFAWVTAGTGLVWMLAQRDWYLSQ